MIPIILVSDEKKDISAFVKQIVKELKIIAYNVVEIFPEKKELAISQIRELKRTVSYRTPEIQLYILHDFDTASAEAQNAFLKTLEEHQEKIQFLLIVKNPHSLVSTVLSRARIVGKRVGQFSSKKTVDASLEKFLKTGDLALLAETAFQSKKLNSPQELFDEILDFFRRRLPNDRNSTEALRTVLRMRSSVENNHVDPQMAIDSILLRLRSLYHKR